MADRISKAALNERVIVHFSCGAASACAAKLAIDRYGDQVQIINAFVADEDPDNRRFLTDCEVWLGRTITVLRDMKYGASAAQVWRKKRFITNRSGAPCSKALKRDVLNAFRAEPAIIVLGYTADKREVDRLDRFIDANATTRVWAPLIEAGMTKRDCLEMVVRAGLELPRMYRLGYHNANCPKCPKGGEGYWNKIRVDFPENFEEMASIQDTLGPGSYFFRDRKTGKRISLRMLDPKAGRFKDEPPVECGAICETPDAELRSASWLIRNGDFYLQGHVGWGALGDADHYTEEDAWKKHTWLVKCGWTSTRVVMLDGSDSPPRAPTATAHAKKLRGCVPPDVERPPNRTVGSAPLILPGVECEEASE